MNRKLQAFKSVLACGFTLFFFSIKKLVNLTVKEKLSAYPKKKNNKIKKILSNEEPANCQNRNLMFKIVLLR